MLKRGLLSLLFCWLVLVPGTSCAATYTMTQEQYSEWQELSAKQAQITSDLQQRGTNSSGLISALQKKITEAENTVKNLQSSLENSGIMLLQSKTIIEQMKQDLLSQQRLIDELKTLLAKLEKQKNKDSSIGPYMSTTSIGIFGTHKNMMVFGGQKWNGGAEVGGGVQVRF